jgi:hypothetical protein
MTENREFNSEVGIWKLEEDDRRKDVGAACSRDYLVNKPLPRLDIKEQQFNMKLFFY